MLVFEPEQENMWNWLGWKLKPFPKICKTVQILCIENQSQNVIQSEKSLKKIDKITVLKTNEVHNDIWESF